MSNVKKFPTKKQLCGNCVCYFRYPAMAEGLGICRLNPPTVTAVYDSDAGQAHYSHERPQVLQNEWCRQWQAIPQDTRPASA